MQVHTPWQALGLLQEGEGKAEGMQSHCDLHPVLDFLMSFLTSFINLFGNTFSWLEHINLKLSSLLMSINDTCKCSNKGSTKRRHGSECCLLCVCLCNQERCGDRRHVEAEAFVGNKNQTDENYFHWSLSSHLHCPSSKDDCGYFIP